MIKVWTDGSCLGNPGFGGWAFIIEQNNEIKEYSGGSPNTTNNRMELTAVIEALKILSFSKENIQITTDSQYVKNGIQLWINNWKKNNWKTSDKKDVKNKDLWEELDNLIIGKDINWSWVKGHSGDLMNEKADILATSYAGYLKNKTN